MSDKKDKNKKEEDSARKFKPEYSIWESMKFGLGFGAGLFVWWVIIAILGIILFGGPSGGSGPMM